MRLYFCKVYVFPDHRRKKGWLYLSNVSKLSLVADHEMLLRRKEKLMLSLVLE